jgi:hypothetical protein
MSYEAANRKERSGWNAGLGGAVGALGRLVRERACRWPRRATDAARARRRPLRFGGRLNW